MFQVLARGQAPAGVIGLADSFDGSRPSQVQSGVVLDGSTAWVWSPAARHMGDWHVAVEDEGAAGSALLWQGDTMGKQVLLCSPQIRALRGTCTGGPLLQGSEEHALQACSIWCSSSHANHVTSRHIMYHIIRLIHSLVLQVARTETCGMTSAPEFLNRVFVLRLPEPLGQGATRQFSLQCSLFASPTMQGPAGELCGGLYGSVGAFWVEGEVAGLWHARQVVG